MYNNLYRNQEAGDILLGKNDKNFLLAASMIASNIEGDYMEVGSWAGGSAVVLCTYMPNDKTLHAIDCDPRVNFQQNIVEYGCQNKINFIHDTYQNYFANIPKDFSLALLFIDIGEHSYEDVKVPTEFLWPFVSKGGLIIFHDYQDDDVVEFCKEKEEEAERNGTSGMVNWTYPEVRKYVDELVTDNNEDSFVKNGPTKLKMNVIGKVGDTCFAVQKM